MLRATPTSFRTTQGQLVQAGWWSPTRMLWVAGLGRRERGAFWVGQGDPGQQSGGLMRARSSQSCARAPPGPRCERF